MKEGAMIDRSAFHTVSYGLYLVTTADDGRKLGCVANTFQQVTSSPARVSVALNKENATTQAILNAGRYAVTVLSEDATMDLIGVFGFRSSLEIDKFADVQFVEDEAGIPCVTDQSSAHFFARVIETVDVGTHYMIIGEVEQAETTGSKPMTYAYYHEVLRGKTPPKASSYTPKEEPIETPAAETQEEAEAAPKKYAWQCTICGHIEYVDELPEGYECPLCGMGSEMFERIEI